MRPILAIAIAFLTCTVFCSGVLADAPDFDFPSPEKPTVASAKIEPKAKPEIKERTVSVVQQITTKDATALRQRLAEVQAEHASLYSGEELVALIEQTEQAVVDRKAELAKKQKDFDSKLAAIRVQLEELRETAAAVGADVSLEIMVTAAKNSKEAKGRPLLKPHASPGTQSNFVPDYFGSDELGTHQLDRFDSGDSFLTPDFEPTYRSQKPKNGYIPKATKQRGEAILNQVINPF